MIQAVGLTKVYGKTVAVDDLSFTVNPGIVTGFLGPNGAGKSTTMRMILGLDTPTRGSVSINGAPYSQIPQPLRQVGALLDANWIHPNRSAKAHLRWMAASNGIPVSRVNEVLDTVGLSAVADKAAGKYSLGMKQRLGIAGALLGEPDILLFDEPVNGLDPEGIHWIRSFLKQLAANGKTVLVSSHLLSEMALTADHLLVIGRGKLISDSSTGDFIANSTTATVSVRSPQLAQLRVLLAGAGMQIADTQDALIVTASPMEQIGDIAAANGITLHELATKAGSLEDAFINLTGDSVEYNATSAPAAPQGI
ncbi:ATP-binding cassette domain-containing protein [Nakamurella antarctica]|uniref:ATP-binding cassette domain-containing protein n=1 Tax=Nakamurella antarctica TaxID=1902245 RepID=A0A3G8ZP80_9ACTN|nr:ATP-binding cassette domain-containing protein [Nakamurella antarctica]AZI59152.1 ATP-binding cassette domain-containing protein [Nakamurella antarctica]